MKNHFQLCLIGYFLFISSILVGQTTQQTPSIFLDCQLNCDFVYIRQEVPFVKYVRDRQVADIYILATSQRAAAGTQEIQLAFEGINQFEGMKDTLVFYYQANVSDAADRETFVKQLKKGLLPYLLRSGLADQIEYKIDTENLPATSEEGPDPWNYWSYNIGAGGNYNGEASFSNFQSNVRASAQKLTEDKKITLFTRYNYARETFTLTDGETIESVINGFFLFTEYVLSINDHWSYGLRADIGSSSFGNTDIDGAFSPTIEYNVYPYSDVSTRRFSFRYSIGPEHYNYTELTIFDKLSETLFRHDLRMEFSQTQKWGDISIDARLRQYLHDLDLFSIRVNPNVELNILKGLRLNFGGQIEYVGDRINIAKSDITDQDILLGIKQLNTNYSFSTYVGFNYRFGSQRNNIVNPRF